MAAAVLFINPQGMVANHLRLLLDDVEHDSENYQGRGLRITQTDRDLDNSL